MCVRVFTATLLLAMIQVIGGGSVRAADPLQTTVAKLLEVGWENSIKSLVPAQEHYEAAKAIAADDPRVPMALALVQLKHRRYTTADELLNEVLKLQADHIAARQGKIWVLMLNKRYPQALVEIENLAKSLGENDAEGAAEESNRAAVLFAGRMYGYLEGPAGDQVARHLLEDHDRKLAGLLTSGRREAFTQGRKAVTDQVAQRTLDEEQLKSEEKEQQEKQKVVDKQRLAEEKVSVDEGKASIEQTASKIERETQALIGEIDGKLAPVNATLNRLSAESQQIRLQIGNLNVEINRLVNLANDTQDPVQRALFFREADRFKFSVDRYQRDLNVVDSEFNRINAQRNILENERRTTVTRYEADMKRLGRQATILNRTEKRIGLDEKKNLKPATGNTSRVQSVSAKVSALTTYVEFPLERERQRVLDSFK